MNLDVLDWEWAHDGYLRDAGSLLRHRSPAAADFQEGLEVGFARAGVPRPPDWPMAVALHDTAAHCERLAHPRHRGEVNLRSIRFVEECVDLSAS